jgi:hypothetical protein
VCQVCVNEYIVYFSVSTLVVVNHIRDLTLAWAGDWLAQDEYDDEVSKLISCAAAVTIHASPSAVDASPKPNLLRKEPASLRAADTTPARDHGSPFTPPNTSTLTLQSASKRYYDLP